MIVLLLNVTVMVLVITPPPPTQHLPAKHMGHVTTEGQNATKFYFGDKAIRNASKTTCEPRFNTFFLFR